MLSIRARSQVAAALATTRDTQQPCVRTATRAPATIRLMTSSRVVSDASLDLLDATDDLAVHERQRLDVTLDLLVDDARVEVVRRLLEEVPATARATADVSKSRAIGIIHVHV